MLTTSGNKPQLKKNKKIKTERIKIAEISTESILDHLCMKDEHQ